MALLVALVAIVVTVAIQHLGRGSGSKLHTAGSSLAADQTASGPASSGSGSGGGGSDAQGSVPTTAPVTSTAPIGTTAPPTTAIPVTTVPPTTAPPTTTTTAGPVTASGTLAPLSSSLVSSSYWQADGSFTLEGADGQPVPGATVTLSVATYRIDRNGHGSWSTTSITVTTDANGVADLSLGPYKRSNANRITEVVVSVTGVDPPSGFTWDGQQPSGSTTPP